MDIIKNYLDNMFASLPNTPQMSKVKNDLFSTMEDKYLELKQSGKSENEAIGIVISEFGNIDELISELGIKTENNRPVIPTITAEQAQNYISARRSAGLLTAIGVFLSILGVAMLIFISKAVDHGIIATGLPANVSEMLGLFALFILIIPAVSLFIYSGMKLDKYKYLDNDFILPAHVSAAIQQKNESYTTGYTLSVIAGVCILLISPLLLFISNMTGKDNSSYGVAALLILVAVAVFIFIYFGSIRESYTRLLKTEEYSEEKKQQGKVIGAVATVVWPLAICIFLITGLVYRLWHINWIIFPITGILFGTFAGCYSILKEK